MCFQGCVYCFALRLLLSGFRFRAWSLGIWVRVGFCDKTFQMVWPYNLVFGATRKVCDLGAGISISELWLRAFGAGLGLGVRDLEVRGQVHLWGLCL